MKKSNQLKFIICSLVLISTHAKVVFSGMGSVGRRSTNSTTPGSVTVSSSSQSTKIECNRGNAVSYGFLKTIFLGDTPKFSANNKKINIELPTQVTACIRDIRAESISNPVDNNIYLKFNVQIDTSVYPAGNEGVEKEYEKCMKHISGGDPSFFTVDKLRANGYISSPAPIEIDTPDIDKNRNSELVIASTKKDLEYRDDIPFGLANVGQNTSFTDSAFNCMDFVKPSERKVMANKTNEYKLREEAIAACNGKNLVDISISLQKLRTNSGGNYDDLTRLLSGIQYSLINDEAKAMIKRIEEIERDISPTADDVENGDKYGVSDAKLKTLLREYAGHMNKFNVELMPSLKAELEHLMTEYEDLGESEEDERKRVEITANIEKINDLMAQFNRQSANGQEYKRLVEALREKNMQSSGGKVLKAIIYAAEFSKVKPEGSGHQSVDKAASNSKRAVDRLQKGTLADWGDEALLRAGDKSPIARRRKIIQGIQSRANKDKQKFQQKLSAYDSHIQNYAQELVSSYCTSGGSYEDCMTVQSTYVPYIYNQYRGWKMNSANEYNTYFNTKYGAAQQEQQGILSRFNQIYNTNRLNNLQTQFDGTSGPGGFNLWTGAETSYASGIPGLNFNLGNVGTSMPATSGFAPQNFNLMGNQQRSPGSSNWSNPYAR